MKKRTAGRAAGTSLSKKDPEGSPVSEKGKLYLPCGELSWNCGSTSEEKKKGDENR